MTVILEAPTRYWKCPSCGTEDRTQKSEVHTQFHPCAALGGVSIPLVEVHDLDARVRARQRLVAAETDGSMASIRTERLDGSNDVTVFTNPAIAAMEG